jgi:hypothetical protein
MALADYEQFRGISHIRRDSFTQNLLYSFIDWLKWSTLQVGGFQNVDATFASGIYGGDFSRLRLVEDPNYSDGQVWEAFRSDWIWETGVSYNVQPIVCSGIWVDGTWYATGVSGAYAHYVDYPQGRVVFQSAIATTSIVTTDYSHRTISYVKGSEPWFRELLFDAYRIDRPDFFGEGSGQWDQIAKNRRHLPVVAIEMGGRRFEPFEIGSSKNYVFQDAVIYVLAESEDERNQIVDIISQQHDKTIWIYHRGRLKESGTYPYDLNRLGSPIDSPLQFPQLVAPTGDGGFRYRKVVLGDMRVQVMDRLSGGRLWRGMLRTTFEGIV